MRSVILKIQKKAESYYQNAPKNKKQKYSELQQNFNNDINEILSEHHRLQRQVDYTMDRFDFYKVKKTMDALDWCWQHDYEGIGEVPETHNLKEHARMHLWQAINTHINHKFDNGRSAISGSGGFMASYDGWDLKLEFTIDSSVTYWDNEELIWTT